MFSFLALREFITLAHTRRSDHRSLILAFFIVLPLQYVLVGLRSFDLFSVFIPVYVFLAIPVLSALAGDPERFLERNAKIQWGITVCVFGLSHAPALLLLEFPNYAGRGAFLLFFLVIVAASAQIVQELASRWLRRRPVARHIDRSFSYRAWLGRRAGRRAGGRAAGVDHALPHLAGDADGAGGRRLRHARRVRDEGAEEGRRRALLGQPEFGHRRRGPARPGGAAVLCRAGVLPFGALVLQPGAMRGRILGIDPGLQTTGFGVVEVDGREMAYVASGTIRTAEATLSDLPARLKIIFDGVREVVDTYQPVCASVEIVFVNVNPQSTLLLGQARGAALASLVSGGLPVAEYTALQLKKAIVGHGHAKKHQVQEMVMRLLKLPGLPGKDAADALGLAITHAHAGASLAAMAKATTLAPRAHAQYRRGRSY